MSNVVSISSNARRVREALQRTDEDVLVLEGVHTVRKVCISCAEEVWGPNEQSALCGHCKIPFQNVETLRKTMEKGA